MNPKLAALYKELPWLVRVADKITNPSVVKVKRLDRQDIDYLWTGNVATLDDFYWATGYFVDENGSYLSMISPQSPSRTRRLADLWKKFWSTDCPWRKNYVTVEQALRECPNKDEVCYIVRFGHDLSHYGCLQLYVYKMPKGITASEFLCLVDNARAEESAAKGGRALEEVRKEMSE